MIPQICIDFLINEETGGWAYYDARARSPVWPGGASGVTIGVGYDLGQQTAQGFRRDWQASLTAEVIAALLPTIGLKGGSDAANAALRDWVQRLSGVKIGWDAAHQVFKDRSLPVYEARTLRAFTGLAALNGLCIGAMVSLVYNRGTSFNGPSRVEMAMIRDKIAAGDAAAVPDRIRAMKRLWPTVPGLLKRRDAEAKMFQDGLDAMAAPTSPSLAADGASPPASGAAIA
jgi:hypothetical protein